MHYIDTTQVSVCAVDNTDMYTEQVFCYMTFYAELVCNLYTCTCIFDPSVWMYKSQSVQLLVKKH